MVFLIDSRITPESIGAVSKAGDKMEGPLTLLDSHPFRSQKADDNRVSDFYTSAMGATVIARSVADEVNTNRVLLVCPQDAQPHLNGALQLADVNAGEWTFYNVHHAGNKKSGSYTGNGSATERSITIGGTGSVCVIYDSTGQSMAICSPAGAIFKNSGSGMISFLNNSALRFRGGVLTLATADSAVNYNGGAYFYQVL